MPLEYGIGGNERPTDASDAISDLQQNRTLLIEHFTGEDPIEPEVVQGLSTIGSVFEHFRPNVEVAFEQEDGSTSDEKLEISGLQDFGSKGITKKSDFLQELNIQQEELNQINRQFRTNKVLLKAFENPDAKASFVSALQELMNEIDEAS
jgi:hypothetical protein